MSADTMMRGAPRSALPREIVPTCQTPSVEMRETFTEFTFEAAHQTPPHSMLHGHSFRVTVYLRGEADPVFGWSHNLDEVEGELRALKQRIDHKYLNDIPGLEVPSLENLTRRIWHALDARMPGIDRVMVRRGLDGQTEGCVFGHRQVSTQEKARS